MALRRGIDIMHDQKASIGDLFQSFLRFQMSSNNNYDDYNGTDGLILLRDLTDELIPFNSEQAIMSVFVEIIVMIGFCIELLIIISCLFRIRRGLNTDTKYMLSLLLADIIFCSTEMVHNFIHLVHGGWYFCMTWPRFN